MLYIGPAGPFIPAERSELDDNSLETRLNNARSRAHREAIEACQRLNIPQNYETLRATLNAPALFVTNGAEGVTIAKPGTQTHVPTKRIENPVDICGACDSFTAGAVCALALGATEPEAAGFGNQVASITVMKPGTGTASPAELLASS